MNEQLVISSTSQVTQWHVDNGIQFSWPLLSFCYHDVILQFNVPIVLLALAIITLTTRVVKL